MAFLPLYLQCVTSPRRGLEAVAAHPRHVRFGAYAVAVTGTTYLLVYFFLSRNGGRPTVFKPWLAIAPEVYYRYNLYLHVPSILLAWVAAAGFTQLAARALGGTGSFEATAAVLGFGIGIASWWTGLHDVVTTFLGYLRVIDQRWYEDAMSGSTPFHTLIWSLMLAYTAWFVMMFTTGVRAAHGLGRLRSALAGTLGFLVYQGVFALFNR
ncbi:MAG: YIP1 family protein [Myxococcales bacterium]|nr:YIP1 family protein [Myxococcales bacterium]